MELKYLYIALMADMACRVTNLRDCHLLDTAIWDWVLCWSILDFGWPYQGGGNRYLKFTLDRCERGLPRYGLRYILLVPYVSSCQGFTESFLYDP